MKIDLILALVFHNAPTDSIIKGIEEGQGSLNPFERAKTVKPSLVWSRRMNGPAGVLLEIDVATLNWFAASRHATAWIFTNAGNFESFLSKRYGGRQA